MNATQTLNVVVADDELVARKRLERLLDAIPGIELVGVHADAAGALAQIDGESIDIAVLDIQMPQMTGLEARALLCGLRPQVIFATAHPEHAVEAFDVGVADFVLKPIEAGRLRTAVDRARAQLANTVPAQVPAPDRLAIAARGGICLIDPHDVTHAVFDGNLVQVHTTSTDPLLTDLSLQELHDRLPGGLCDRVHRRALLNLRHVTRLDPTACGGFTAVVGDHGGIPVSRQVARRLRRTFLAAGRPGGD